ncbi:MAG TPA: hypothetical protein VGG10_13030 [Rhizomicrobium sp.]|jgi:hypothetical protein
MTTTHWRNAVTGDFAKAGKWDDGRPGIKDDAFIAATGPDYIVKVVGADAAHALTLDSADATLKEKAHGSLHVGTLDIEAGTAILTQANTIGSIALSGGDLKFSDSAALGNAAIAITHQAILSATANVEIANDIAVKGASLEASNDTTLKLDGALTFDTSVAEQLNVVGNNANGAADGSGVIDLDGSIGTMAPHTFLLVSGVTLASSIEENSAFDAFLSGIQTVDIENHGVLDITHQNNILMDDVVGDGEILNSGPRENLTLGPNHFEGQVRGDFDLTIAGGFSGTIALKSGDAIHVVGGISFEGTTFIGDAPPIDLKNPPVGGGNLYLDDTTFTGAPPSVDLGTGQNIILQIDHTFGGTISNFGGHNGGTDYIRIVDENGKGAPTLQYEPNATQTGGELIIQFGTAPAFHLNLLGTYTQDDFKIDPDDSAEIDCSAEQPSPHVPAHVLDALI